MTVDPQPLHARTTSRCEQGDEVDLHITNLEQARGRDPRLRAAGYNVNLSLEPGETTTSPSSPTRPGVFPFYCTEFCSALHLEMMGYFLVKPYGSDAVLAPGSLGIPAC